MHGYILPCGSSFSTIYFVNICEFSFFVGGLNKCAIYDFHCKHHQLFKLEFEKLEKSSSHHRHMLHVIYG